MKPKSNALRESLREHYRDNVLKWYYTNDDHAAYLYSSENGKIGINRLNFQDYADVTTDKEYKLLMRICLEPVVSHDPVESGTVWLDYRNWPGYSRQFFGAAIKKFEKLKIIEWTQEGKWYILNPRDVNSYYKVKIKNNEKKGVINKRKSL